MRMAFLFGAGLAWEFLRQHLAAMAHRMTCQSQALGRTIVFTCRAADAMLDTGEARRHSRESYTLLRAVSLSHAALRVQHQSEG
jgi:hypothetical protein